MTQAASSIQRDSAIRLGRNREHQFERRKPMHEPAPPVLGAKKPRPAMAGRILGATAVLGIVAALGLWAAKTGAGWLSGYVPTDDETSTEIVIGDDVLNVPANMIRLENQRRGGVQARLDLFLKWPELTGFRLADERAFLGDRAEPRLIFVSLEPRKLRLDMSGRFEPLYSRLLEGAPSDAGNGLVRKALPRSLGFVDEDLLYEAASPYPYAARCIRAGSTTGAPYCLRDIHVGRDLSLTYRFHVSMIGQWMDIETAIRARAHEMLLD